MKKQRNRSLTDKGTTKFMQSLSKTVWDEISELANKRGITVQEYIRAIIIPNHLELIKDRELPIVSKKYSKRAKKAWATRRRKKALYDTEKVTEITPKPKQVPEPWETDKRPDL